MTIPINYVVSVRFLGVRIFWWLLIVFIFQNSPIAVQEEFLETGIGDEQISSSLSLDQKIHSYNNVASSLGIGQKKLIFYYTNRALEALEVSYNDHEFARAHYQLARIYFYLKNWNRALESILVAKRKIRDKKILAQILILAAGIYAEKNYYEESLRFYEEFEKIASFQQNDILLKKCQIAMNLRRFGYAVKCFQEFLEISKREQSPLEALGYVGLGLLEEKQNRRSNALSFLQRAVLTSESWRISEYMAITYFTLGQFFYNASNHQESNFYIQKALLSNKSRDLNSLDSDIYQMLYKNFLAQGQATQSLEMLRLQHENNLALLEERQATYEFLFQNNIEIRTHKREIHLLSTHKNKKGIIITIIMMALCIFIIVLIFVIRKIGEKNSQLHSVLLAFRTDKREIKHGDQYGLLRILLQKKGSYGLVIVILTNYKILIHQCDDLGIVYCCNKIGQQIANIVLVEEVEYFQEDKHCSYIPFWAETCHDFHNIINQLPPANFMRTLVWKGQHLDAQFSLSTCYICDRKE